MEEARAICSAVLRRWCELIIEHIEDLARLITAEQRMPLAESRVEVVYAASFVEWFAEEARRAYGEIILGHEVDRRLMALKQPLRVVGVITSWNFPAVMATRRAAPAIVVGCAAVLGKV